MEPAVSVRPCLKTHESQNDNSLNVCPVVEDEMDEEDIDDKEEQSEESRGVRVGKKMMTPTLVEREEHERTHIPHRSWCRHCVAARASNPAHLNRKFARAVEGDKDVKLVSYDCCFMRDQLGMESATILKKDRATRMVSAHVVIQQCTRDLERLGHCGQITLKSDQEAAIVNVLREIANLRGSRGTLLEHSPVADSQSNGFIERGIRSLEEMTRVISYDLPSRVGSPISVHSPVFPWIVERATDILNQCHVASDGKSAYERLKRRQHRGCFCHSEQR